MRMVRTLLLIPAIAFLPSCGGGGTKSGSACSTETALAISATWNSNGVVSNTVSGKQGVQLTATPSVTGIPATCAGKETFSASQSLPAGLSIDSKTGVVSGTPTVAGSYAGDYLVQMNLPGYSPISILSTITIAPTAAAKGIWKGTTSDGRSATSVVLDDGAYWVLYSLQNNSAKFGGAIQGSSTSQNGTFTASAVKDFNLQAKTISNVTVSGTYASSLTLDTTANYASGVQLTITSTYDTAYDLTPSLSTLAGTYTGTAYTAAGSESATAVFDAIGNISGNGTSGCTFTGTAAPHSTGNVYDISITFGGGVCVNGTSTVTGVAIFDSTTKQLSSAALDSTRTSGFIYGGTKP